MILIEAIRTGKNIRRQGESDWLVWGLTSRGETAFFSIQDLLADDWEVEDEKVLVNYETFYQCLNSKGLCPNTGGGVAIDVGAAWKRLLQLTKERT